MKVPAADAVDADVVADIADDDIAFVAENGVAVAVILLVCSTYILYVSLQS